ncbi:sigma-54-dependent transcriptional regulator [Croceimicrobium hydrocarbonivorans]|uniref:Sigma-54-dependent Fis family transcriptional regulator n=1 Tax=Croceimicrobium hydrocarbonivorans TaxID=2761580 RepID=A0A7H0VA91_9FLAO|nr:sigma-54 dependent transcriptional regulator [Croceimicrobium hydrocarbonivorans]QNR22639.1 sigma-54-dependent Fis family transcriptional regulator [Croceimicrobium hydrocarbonivorans]
MKSAARILIIDDDADLRESLALYLKIHFSKVSVLGDPRKVHEALNQEEYDLILLDMNFQAGRNDGQEGLYWLKHIKELRPEIMVLLITAYGDIDLAIEALKSGASDFILKPWQNQKLLAALLRAYELKSTKGKLKQFQQQQDKSGNELIQLLENSARSASSIALLQQARRVAETDAQVLIRGENGTGKSQLARYLHLNSLRKDAPLVSVDLGAIPENLFEAELFGVKKGAFTDAREDRSGLVQQAEGGSLFLDEIGNCSLLHQQKLLRLIQDQSYQIVGSPELRHCNVRIIAASNSDLELAVKEGLFRQDLYYRINTIELKIEALRNRQEDLEVLIDYYLDYHNRKYGRQLELETDQRAQLLAYTWPGNIRELSHSLERAVILKDGHFEQSLGSGASSMPGNEASDLLSLNLEELEAQHIHQVLNHYQGNISKTAQHLGVNRNTLYRKLDKYQIQHEV